MKLKKAKILLNKINNLFAGISDNPGKASAMERDLLLNHLRDLYDIVLVGEKEEEVDATTLQYQALLKEKEASLRKLEEARAKAERNALEERKLREEAEKKASEKLEMQKIHEEAARHDAKLKEEEENRKKEALEREILKQAELNVAEETRKRAELEARLKMEQDIKLQAAKEAAEKAISAKENELVQNNPAVEVKPATVHGSDFDEEMEELFEREETMELSQKISLRPIKDIKKAISINDRSLYINELYNKDTSEMEKTIETLNNLENFDQARLYLEQKVINQFNWLAKKRKRRAIEFIEVVRRRFL